MKEQKSHSLPESKENFKVPDRYFEDFDGKLFTKWDNTPAIPPKKSLSISRLVYFGAAASAVVLLGLSFWFTNNNQVDLKSAEMENYLQFNASTSDIAQDFNAEDFKEFEKTLNLNELKIDDYLLTSTDIEFYLNEE
ncbi:hypothetical protein [Flavobacterium sp. HSC-61S13]|uniref:hypothetical protein n=1 Tax=Flavobacterium sp. HSC-61S13 TaxID=2910963 RepID=UPI00209E4278|nr:hypothetical protein [Flavobacterium sp. HSC-61S13]MCP1996048.1 hypothetical protein [Flavobacterium sp. HSC-61S13]